MASHVRASILSFFAWVFALSGCLAVLEAGACAQPPAATKGAASRTVKALMVSDIHFEPFWDPAKVAQLSAAPANAWKAILAGPDSADRAQRFSELEQSCKARGVDTSYALLASSLAAMRADAGGARFVTVSGDLIAHSFECKYRTLYPQASAAEYRALVEKTIEFVVGSLRETVPGVPVYVALGNNDSDCGDYQLDAHSEFLAAVGRVVADGLPEADRKQAMEDFAAGGYFSAALPIKSARMLVLDDVFMARKYATCAGKPDARAGAEQVAWLKAQLERGRSEKENIWVMAHIPPGVDPYSTATKSENICTGKAPTMFLSSEAMEETLAEYGDVIRLAIFAHTHMDEVRLLVNQKPTDWHGPVAAKLVPSISPINGNAPAFTMAEVDLETAVLKDYRVFAASNKTGVGATWSEEYDYARDFGQPAFSAAAVRRLIDEFAADRAGQSPVSQNYLSHYFVGAGARELAPFWPEYVCALNHDEPTAYRGCVCGTK
jgi:sphingomyelin phosphodiesterase acid-like 3